MIHEAFNKTAVAIRYYKITNPERKYTRHYALKQWRQDAHIDRSVLELVISTIFAEQKTLLKKK